MARPLLGFELCDVWGNALADPLVGHTDGQVDMSLGAQRTAQCTLKTSDPALLAGVPALERTVRTYWRGGLIAASILLDPDWRIGQGQVVLAGGDVRLRLDRANLHAYYTATGRLISDVYSDLIGLAANRPYPPGAPPLGVFNGTLQYTGLPNEPQNLNYEPGVVVGDKLDELQKIAGAPEVEFQPVYRTDGYHWQMNAWAGAFGTYGQGQDRSGDVVFYYNCVEHNCEDMTWTPSGSPVRNRTTVAGPPEDDGTLDPDPQTSEYSAGVLAAGPYEEWISLDQSDSNVKLNAARYNTSAYGRPPNSITVVPAEEADAEQYGVPPLFGVDYGLGDLVRAVGRRDNAQVDELARVERATLKEVGAEENRRVKVTLELAPDVSGTAVT